MKRYVRRVRTPDTTSWWLFAIAFMATATAVWVLIGHEGWIP